MLEIKNLCTQLGTFQLNHISFQVEKGDYLTILGLSGAGKTVLLELLAGLVKPTSGSIHYLGEDLTRSSIQSRPFGLVYQDMALFPHLTVHQNIMYPMKARRVPVSRAKTRIHELASLTQTDHLLKRYPGTLSGGEAQRVALARILAADPEVLLLDEPLASLDVKLKQQLRELLKKINQSGKTIIHVTHDFMEAATLSKKIAIIENGTLIQWGVPDEVFRNPVSEFVARFSGIKNIFPCQFHSHEQHNGIYKGITINQMAIHLVKKPEKDHAHLMIPGEDIIVSEKQLQTSAINQYKGTVTDIYTLHNTVELIVKTQEEFSIMVSKKSLHNLGLYPGKEVWISFKASAVRIL